MNIKKLIPKIIAMLLVGICVGFFMRHIDARVLAKLDSMSAADYVQHQREAIHHSFTFTYFIWLIICGFYIACVEVVAYIIGLCFKKPAA